MEKDSTENEMEKKLQSYKEINTELSKKLNLLKEENAKIKNVQKLTKIKYLRLQNELIGLKKKFADSKKVHAEHVNSLSNALQSYVFKMNFLVANTSEVVNIGETSKSDSSGSNNSSKENSRRLSRSFESPSETEKSLPIADQPDDNYLETITEENDDLNDLESNSLSQSTIKNVNSSNNNDSTSCSDKSNLNESSVPFSNALLGKTISFQKNNPNADESNLNKTNDRSASNSILSTSRALISNKENETTTSKTETKLMKSSPLRQLQNNSFITRRRKGHSQKDINEQSIDDINMSDAICSTPNNLRRETKSSTIGSLLSESMENVSNSRPKRKAAQGNLKEPKLNTKLRRPLTY